MKSFFTEEKIDAIFDVILTLQWDWDQYSW